MVNQHHIDLFGRIILASADDCIELFPMKINTHTQIVPRIYKNHLFGLLYKLDILRQNKNGILRIKRTKLEDILTLISSKFKVDIQLLSDVRKNLPK